MSDHRIAAVFAKRLKQARELRGLSQRALGALVDEDNNKNRGAIRVNRYEQLVNRADMDIASKMAKELHVPLAFLFAESDELAELILGFDQLDPADKAKVVAQVQKLAGKT